MQTSACWLLTFSQMVLLQADGHWTIALPLAREITYNPGESVANLTTSEKLVRGAFSGKSVPLVFLIRHNQAGQRTFMASGTSWKVAGMRAGSSPSISMITSSSLAAGRARIFFANA